MNAFTIKDLENLTGIRAHTIRIWEQRYSFLKPQRTETNIRYYTGDELKTILNIALLNKYGYKISHIDKMTFSEIKEKTISLTQAQAQQERIINELIEHMVEINIDRFEDLLDQHIQSRGIEKTISFIIFPFLERIGLLWVTNHVNPAQEHLVTNLIRQKIIVGIEQANPHIQRDRSALLFLPENQFHELGLLYVYYMLKCRGIKVYYIGANVPFEDLEFVMLNKKPTYMYTHLSSLGHNISLDKFFTQVQSRLPNLKLYVSGTAFKNYKKSVPANTTILHSIPEVLEVLTA